MLKKIKQKQNWIIEIITCAIMFWLIINRSIGNADEFWVFSYGKNVANGLTLYKDISICVTPFAILLLSLAIKIFGTNLFVYRIMTCLIYGGCYIFGSKILWKRSNKNSFIHILYSIFFISMSSIMFYEYNIVNTFLLMTIMYLETKEKHDSEQHYNLKVNLLLGILAGLVVMTKQSTGLVLLICITANVILNKKNVKEILYRILGFVITIAVFCIYLFATGAASHILDLTVFGIDGFTENTTLSLILKTFIAHIEILFILIYFITKMMHFAWDFLKKKEISKEEQKQRTIFVYMLTSLCIVYPLLDYTHFSIALIPLLPYLFNDIRKILDNERKIPKILFYIFLGLWLFWNVLLFDDSNYTNQVTCGIPYYKGLNVESETNETMENIISKVREYDEAGLDVYILDSSAMPLLTPLDIYHKYYDCLLIGNTGTADIDTLIKKKCNKGNVLFYLKDERMLNYQMPKNIKSILIENGMTVVDEGEYFDIYMKSYDNTEAQTTDY